MRHLFTIFFAFTAFSNAVHAANLQRCSGHIKGQKTVENIFYSDGTTIVLIGYGTEFMYVPYIKTVGSDKVFKNAKYSIKLSNDTVMIKNRDIWRKTYVGISCHSTDE